jgi:hypothetical protein
VESTRYGGEAVTSLWWFLERGKKVATDLCLQHPVKVPALRSSTLPGETTRIATEEWKRSLLG